MNNQTDREIYKYLTDRYGDWILFDPPLKMKTILLWILPFTWPAAAAGTTFFLLLSIPIISIVVSMTEILNVHPSISVPGKPGCFDKSTQIQTKKGFTEI
jgi:cytochrome c-type biogenesis protein CcmH/NrfF